MRLGGLEGLSYIFIYVLEGGSFSVIRGIIEIRDFQNIERGLDLIYSSGTY